MALQAGFCADCPSGQDNGRPLVPIHLYRAVIPTVPRTPDAGLLRAVGMVQNDALAGPATAWIVADGGGCYAVTNYHVAFGVRHPSVNQTMTIAFGQGKENWFELMSQLIPFEVAGLIYQAEPSGNAVTTGPWFGFRVAWERPTVRYRWPTLRAMTCLIRRFLWRAMGTITTTTRA